MAKPLQPRPAGSRVERIVFRHFRIFDISPWSRSTVEFLAHLLGQLKRAFTKLSLEEMKLAKKQNEQELNFTPLISALSVTEFLQTFPLQSCR
jgi:hypothetical protein